MMSITGTIRLRNQKTGDTPADWMQSLAAMPRIGAPNGLIGVGASRIAPDRITR